MRIDPSGNLVSVLVHASVAGLARQGNFINFNFDQRVRPQRLYTGADFAHDAVTP
jgi:hypothetical protein